MLIIAKQHRNMYYNTIQYVNKLLKTDEDR